MRSDWFEQLRERVIATGAIDLTEWDNRLPDLIAASDAIRYLHLGNPEALLVSSPQVMEAIERHMAAANHDPVETAAGTPNGRLQ